MRYSRISLELRRRLLHIGRYDICKRNQIRCHNSHSITTSVESSKNASDLIYCHRPSEWPDGLLENITSHRDVNVFPNFVTEDEEKQFDRDTWQQLRRLRYEEEHWDDAIHRYREIEKSNWSPICQKVIQRVREIAFPSDSRLLSSVHVLDLAQDGWIKPHIDSERYCGDIIAGLSLLTDSVMRMVHKNRKELIFDIYLKRYSLYIMKGVARYEFTHEVLPNDQSYFNGAHVPRISRRLAVICRLLPNSKKGP